MNRFVQAMRTWRGPIGFAVGLLLIAAVVVVLIQNSGQFTEAMRAASHAHWWLIAAMLLLPVCNALIVAWSFQVIMNRFGRVPYDDMLALILSAWLLNYLPMRPGLMGRLVYHKTVHRVSLKRSLAVSVALALMTALAAAHLLAVWMAFTQGIVVGSATLVVSAAGVYWLAGIAADRSPAGAVPRGALRAALLMRYADLAVWAVRLSVAFAIIGEPIPIMIGVLLAAAIQLAYLFPLTGSGLGVAEWAVGLVVAVTATSLTMEDGFAASLINRAAELATAIPLGLLAGGYIARQRRKHRVHQHSAPLDAVSGLPRDPPDSGGHTDRSDR